MDYPLRLLAGAFAGAAALLLIGGGLFLGELGIVATGAVLATSMMSFFAGEANGRRHAEGTEASS